MANIDDIKWLRYAYKVAAEQSTDPSTQNGACLVDMTIVPGGFLMVESANHFPRGVAESPERWERPLKYSYVEHAERNVIYAAAACGVKTKGFTLYVPWYSCAECARAIIQAGIAEVVGHKAIFERTMARWKDSIALALGMLDEAQVPHRLVDCEIGNVEVRLDGGLWHP